MWEFVITAGEGTLIKKGVAANAAALNDAFLNAVEECLYSNTPISEMAMLSRPIGLDEIQERFGAE